MWELLQPEIQQFIKNHENDDPYQLSLSSTIDPGWPKKEIVQQIESRQKAKHKLPEWYNQSGILWPPSLSVEQASSQIAAKFKSQHFQGNIAIDLTGGAGIDSYYLSQSFGELHYVEENEDLVAKARHNFKTLGQENINCHHKKSEEFLTEFNGRADLIYIDPSRRAQKKIFRLQDSVPNVVEMMPRLLEKGEKVLIKGSPLQDIQQVTNLFSQMEKIWVVAIQNDCKELLFLLTQQPKPLAIAAVNFINQQEKQEFNFEPANESVSVSFARPHNFLYEPNVAILKAGAFKSIAAHFNLHKLHPNSHLYTSNDYLTDFPGRIFQTQKILSFNKKAKQQLPDKINIISRNFPATVDQIAKKLHIKEGGELFLIATTLANGEKKLLLATRLQ